jgi:hypothetical protein
VTGLDHVDCGHWRARVTRTLSDGEHNFVGSITVSLMEKLGRVGWCTCPMATLLKNEVLVVGF